MHNDSNTRQTAPFTRVVVNGDIDITLYTGDKTPGIKLHGDPRNFADIQSYTHNGVLHVTLGKGYPHFGRVRADLHTHYLTSFNYHGAGQIIAKHIQSGMLDLAINNTGETLIDGKIALRKLLIAGTGYTRISGITSHGAQIKLTGKPHVRLAGIINVASIHLAGDSSISLYWIKSHVLKVRAKDHAFIQMAGIADTLDVALTDNARFNGRYLRGADVFVKTFGHSVADICVTNTQHTLASGASNIYFHNLPKTKADFMASNGSVLDMREWGVPNMQDYTRYNR